MALFLKSTKLLYKGVSFTRQGKFSCLKNANSLLQWEHLIPINAVVGKYYSSPSPQILTTNMLEKSIYQLNLDLRYKNRIYKEDVEQILRALQHWGNITYSQSLLLLTTCGSLSFLESHHKRVNMCMEIWKTLQKAGVKFDICHYNTLLNVYIENEHKFSPEEFLKELESKGLEPNLVTYQRLLRAYCLRGEVNAASNLLEKMKQQGLPLNEYIFNSLILCHCQIGDIDSAYGIMDLMTEKGIELTSETYHNLLCGLAKNGHLDKMNKVLEECDKKEIVILDKDILELSYVLACNGYSTEAYDILKKVKKQFGYNKYAALLVYKLLQKNLDSLAQEIFLSMEEREGDHENKSLSKFLIDYYINFRSVKEVLDVCEVLKEKGFSVFPFNYALKKFISDESPQRCFEFFSCMRNAHIPLRSHYFWPLIIKAKDGGKNEINGVLGKMKKFGVNRCYLTATKIVYPNYAFGKDWNKDIDTLTNNGIDEGYITWKLLHSFISSNKINDAELLASSRPVFNVTMQLPQALAKNVLNHPENVQSVVKILYYLLHDHLLRIQKGTTERVNLLEKDTDETVQDGEENLDVTDEEGVAKPRLSFIPKFIYCLLQQTSCNKDILRVLLETMVVENIPVPPDSAKLIKNKYNNPEIESLLDKLTSLEFSMNDEIVSKKEFVLINFSPVRKLAAALDPAAEEMWEAQGSQLVLNDLIGLVYLHAKRDNIEDAMKFVRLLPKAKGDFSEARQNESINLPMFRVILRTLAKNEKPEYIKEAIECAIESNIMKKGDYNFLMNYYLRRLDAMELALSNSMNYTKVRKSSKSSTRNERPKSLISFHYIVITPFDMGIKEAVDTFVDYMCRDGNITGYSNLIGALIRDKESELLKRVTNAIADSKGENLSLTLLLLEFLSRGIVKQARKLIETKGFVLSSELFLKQAKSLFEKNSTLGLESLLEVGRDMVGLNCGILYKYLLQLYIRQNDTEKVERLWLQAQEDGFTVDEDFIDKMNAFLVTAGKTSPFDTTKMNTEGNIQGKRNGVDTSTKEISDSSAKALSSANERRRRETLLNLAKEGNYSKLLKLVHKAEVIKDLTLISTFFLKNKKYEEHLQFIRGIIKNGNNSIVHRCFPTIGVKDLMLNHPKLWEEYKSIAIKFAEEGNSVKPIINCWFCCLANDTKQAEKIFDEYLVNNDSVAKYILRMRAIDVEVLEEILSHAKYKSVAELTSACYTRLLKHNVLSGALNDALAIIERAVEENVADSLDKYFVNLLEAKLQEKGKDFPYKELLKKDEIMATESA